MFFSILLQSSQEITVNVGATGFYVSVGGVIGTLGLVIWRMSRAFNSKADKSFVEEKMSKKVDSDDFDEFKRDHEKRHESINDSFIKEMDRAAQEHQKFVQDIMSRIEENTQNQREFNKEIARKQETLLTKVIAIETNMNTLITDYNNRQKQMIRGGE